MPTALEIDAMSLIIDKKVSEKNQFNCYLKKKEKEKEILPDFQVCGAQWGTAIQGSN